MLHPSSKNSSNFSTLPQVEGGFFDVISLVDFLRSTRNDLEAPALSIAPEIASVLEEIVREPAALFARMSGSGATCFGIFADHNSAHAAAAAIRARHDDWWVAAANLASPGHAESLA
jgi:4-diphosphocytidyl-2-C-methyl-D-erythritol kinase